MRISSLLPFAIPVAAFVFAPLVQAQSQPQSQPIQGSGYGPRPPHRPQPPHRPAQWRLLAFKTVGAGTDRDTINVNRAERYREIQLCSFNAPIRMVDFKIRFENGRRQDVRVRSMIAARSCTRAVRLDGNGARRIQRVDLTYERVQRGMRTPLIRVMAR